MFKVSFLSELPAAGKGASRMKEGAGLIVLLTSRSMVRTLHNFCGEPGMCCIKASERENQSQAQHTGHVGLFFLRGKRLLDQSGWYQGQQRGGGRSLGGWACLLV